MASSVVFEERVEIPYFRSLAEFSDVPFSCLKLSMSGVQW